MARSTLLAILCVAVAGCGGGCSGSVEDRDESPQGSASQRTEASGGERGDGDEATPQADPGPRPEVRITADVDDHSRHVTPRVANHGAEASLSSTLVLERQAGDGWEPVDGVELALRFDCDAEAPECVTLAPGAVFIPPPWLGTIGHAQCACERCVAAEPGTYRFAVRSCGGGHTVPGESFELP